MLSAVTRTVSSTILCIAALSGLLRQPSESLKVPTPPAEAAPAAASVPAIAAILGVTPQPSPTIANAPAVVKSCPCSGQCTCGCQAGRPCQCGKATTLVSAAPPPNVVAGGDQRWLKSGQPWTRAALLSHLYYDQENHGQHAPGSLDGMPLEELLAIHNGEHDIRRPAAAVRTAPRMIVSSGGCPGGQCPPQRRFR